MILQRDPRLNDRINKYGCYLMFIFYEVNKYTNYMFSPQIINDLYKVFVSHGYMDKDCYITDPNTIFAFLDLPVKYTDRHESIFRRCEEDEFEALMFRLDRPNKDPWIHFTAGSGRGTVTYDPYGCSKAVAEGRLMSKRIFRRIKNETSKKNV